MSPAHTPAEASHVAPDMTTHAERKGFVNKMMRRLFARYKVSYSISRSN